MSPQAGPFFRSQPVSFLTYLLTCYLTHVAHHYRIHTAP